MSRRHGRFGPKNFAKTPLVRRQDSAIFGIEGSRPDDFAVGRPVQDGVLAGVYEAMGDYVRYKGGKLWPLVPIVTFVRDTELAFGLNSCQAAADQLRDLQRQRRLPASVTEEFRYSQRDPLQVHTVGVAGVNNLYRILVSLNSDQLQQEQDATREFMASREASFTPEIELAVWRDIRSVGPVRFRAAMRRVQLPREAMLGIVGVYPVVASE